MANNLAIRESLFVRVLRALKLVDVAPDGTVDHSAGADFIPNNPSVPGYDPLSSLSAMARFPWVYSAVTALATDTSGVPIRAIRGKGADAETLPDHPVLALLDNPSSKVPSKLFLRQLVTDLALVGDAFVLVAGDSEPQALLRLHPSRVRIMPQPDGQPMEYEYAGGNQPVRYSFDQVLHIRTPSWNDNPQSLWGVGAIQSLHNDLMTDMRTQELTAASAETGRPTGIISPSEDGDRWSMDQLRTIREAYEKQMSSGSGLLVMGGAVDYTAVGWSPKDMEFQAVREFTRSSVLAVLDVPPTRVGLPSANYATSREQAKRYWESISGRCTLISAEFTRLARMFPDSDDVRVEFDFSEIEALQESRTDRLNRVMTWATLGVPVADAAAYEGFDDLPTDNLVDAYAMTDEPVEDDVEGDVEAGVDWLTQRTAQPVTRAKYDDIDFSVPDGVREELERGLAWHEDGKSGDGLTPATVSWARRMANGENITPEKARKMRAWLARHETDKDGEGFKPDQDGFPSPGRVSWALWGGDPAVAWSNKLVRQMDAEDEGESKDVLPMSRDMEAPIELDICEDLESREARDEYMRQFVNKFHSPFERSLNTAVRRHLRGQAARTAKRLGEALPQKKAVNGIVTRADFGFGFLLEILAGYTESTLLRNAVRPIVERMTRQSIFQALKQTQLFDQEISPEWIGNQVDKQVNELVTNVQKTTEKLVSETIEAGLEQDKTIGELQNDLMQSHGFDAQRALRIARTETTKAVNTGQRKTFEELANRGVDVEMVWLASPGARDAHRALDGHTTEPGKPFVVPTDGGKHAGKKTQTPGGFGVAALDINCRCSISANVKQPKRKLP